MVGAPTPLKPLLNFERFRSSDMSDVQRHSSQTFGSERPYIELERPSASFHFVHNQFELEKTSLHSLNYNCSDCAVRVEMQMQPFLLLQFCMTGAAELGQDGTIHHTSPAQFAVIHGDSPLTGRLLPGYSSMILVVSRLSLETALATEIGRRPDRPLIFESGCFGNVGPGAALSSMCMTMCRSVDDDDLAPVRLSVTRRMEDLIVSMILWSIPHNYSEELNRNDGYAPPYVRRVERFIGTNASSPMNIANLVAISGVSERTLHDGFRKYRRTSPLLHLKMIRLDLARQALTGATNDRVSDVAMECGFTHFGKFAVDYRERFGERPSDTLRRNQSKT
jgi:AraC-like DNA-binding protein